jgi:hypothetical protein
MSMSRRCSPGVLAAANAVLLLLASGGSSFLLGPEDLRHHHRTERDLHTHSHVHHGAHRHGHEHGHHGEDGSDGTEGTYLPSLGAAPAHRLGAVEPPPIFGAPRALERVPRSMPAALRVVDLGASPRGPPA